MITQSVSISRDGDIVKTKYIEEEVADIKNLMAEIDGLSQHKMPGDKELLEWARRGEVHPYFEIANRLAFLRDELARAQAIPDEKQETR